MDVGYEPTGYNMYGYTLECGRGSDWSLTSLEISLSVASLCDVYKSTENPHQQHDVLCSVRVCRLRNDTTRRDEHPGLKNSYTLPFDPKQIIYGILKQWFPL